MTYGSLFSGIGGIDLGLDRAGMTCKWQVEIDPFCRKVLAKHWPDVRRHDDVKTFPPNETEDWSVDLIAGGFPCQDISYAGKGAGLAGERSGLWFEYARVIRDLQPKYVLVENVSALLARGLDSVLGTLASLGYDAEWHCVQAADVGAPHLRDRIFIVAYTKGPVFRTLNRGARGGETASEREARGGFVREGLRSADDGLPTDPGEKPRNVADAGGMQPERWRESSELAGSEGASEVDGEQREWNGDSLVDRGQDAADTQRAERRPCRPEGCELDDAPHGLQGGREEDSGRDRIGCPQSLTRFRDSVGRDQWGVDPADAAESGMGRMVTRLPNRLDRLRGLGNAVVPQVAQWFGERIILKENMER